MTTAELIALECDEIKEMLLEKNKRYGDSALNPKRVFSRATAIEQILVRIDDKISRIANTENIDDNEDAVKDLIGYLVLLRVAQRSDVEPEKMNNQLDAIRYKTPRWEHDVGTCDFDGRYHYKNNGDPCPCKCHKAAEE